MRMKKLPNDILDKIAQKHARMALQKAIQEGKEWISNHEEQNKYLVWYNIEQDNARVYELRTDTGNDPNTNKESRLIVRVIMDYYTGNIIHDIEVHLPPIKDIRTIFRINEKPRLQENLAELRLRRMQGKVMRIILDTSAVRFLSRNKLDELAKVYSCDLMMSPVSFYELLSHIDDCDRDGMQLFDRVRGNILKCKLLKLLDDPFYEVASELSIKNINQTRTDDRKMIPKILDALDKSKTLDDFYKKYIKYDDGRIAAIAGVGKRIKEELEKHEKEYKCYIKRQILNLEKTFASEGDKNRFMQKSSEIRVYELLKTMLTDAVDRSINNGEIKNRKNAWEKVLRKYLISYGFSAYKIIIAHEKKNKLAGNDCEDWWISFHLDYLSNDCFLCGDSKTIESINFVLKICKKIDREHEPSFTVKKPHEFVHAQEMSRSRSDPNYVSRYNQTMISP
jgi:hypothetical protein